MKDLLLRARVVVRTSNREFKKLRRSQQQKRHLKIQLFVRLSVFYDYSMFVTLYETGEVYFLFFWYECFSRKGRE